MKPVAYILRNEYDEYRLEPMDDFDVKTLPIEVEIPLVPKREWVGLTQDEAAECWAASGNMAGFGGISFEAIRAVEAKLREKNT